MADIATNAVVARTMTLPPSWRQRIAELSNLNPDWDGEGAKAIKPHVLVDLAEVLQWFVQRMPCFREPFLAPTFDGFVQMEWHDERRSLEIEAINEGWSLAGAVAGTDGKRHYFAAECGRTSLEELEAAYKWFADAEPIWPSR